ncbi:MAG: efflux RND transporter periplasmic adaptor subunit [Steroidobacteraceae bacterium]|jgi:RND family efflux transporter MFP subunit|nr:efflux RND transporter periplasmic adaptor subunit [Steroidobacteraceae bacterium]
MRTPQDHPDEAPWTRRLLLRKHWVFAAAVGIVAAVTAAVWMYAAARSPPLVPIADRRFVPLVSTMIPGLRPVTSQVLVTGTITARHDLPIGDGGGAGRIVKVYVQVGDQVKRGEVLARLDDSVLKPQVEELAASLAKARAQAALSAADERRAIAIGPDGGLSAQDIEKSRATAAMDAANVQMVAAQLRQKRAQLALTRVLSPAPGIVLTRDAEVGQIASPGGAALFTLEEDGQVELRGQVAEQDLASLKIGQPAEVHLIGYRHAFPGSIWLLGATINPQTRLGEVRIALQPSPALRPGSFARAVITESHAERPVVPQTAVMASAGGSYLFIVNHDGRVARRSVVLGGVISSGVVIRSGLTGTERVVTLAGGFLQNGEAVRVAPTRTRGS